jgi:hypothetical protein
LELIRRSYAFIVKSLSHIDESQESLVHVSGEFLEPESEMPAYTSELEASMNLERSNPKSHRRKQNMEDVDREGDVSQMISSVTEDVDPGNEIAWLCISQLVNIIVNLTSAIENQSSSPDIAANSKIKTITKQSQSRLQEIMKAAPVIQLIQNRENFMIILFDQIRTCNLSKLPQLLSIIRNLMLFGTAEDSTPPVKNFTVLDRKYIEAGIGLVTNINDSKIWKSLFGAVGYSRGFDYLRRNDCVIWYMNLRKDAKDLSHLKNSLRQNSKLNSHSNSTLMSLKAKL